MSHIVKQKSTVTLKNIVFLAASAAKLGGEFKNNQKTATYYRGKKTKCDHAISFPGTKYEIGVIKNDDGTFTLAADLIAQTLRAKMDKIFRRYSIEEANHLARLQGHRAVGETVLPNNQIQMQYEAF